MPPSTAARMAAATILAAVLRCARLKLKLKINWFNRGIRRKMDRMKRNGLSRGRQQPLEAGQVWSWPDARLSVESVGKLLVHYKLGRPDAKRVSTSCNGIKTIEKYLKTNKAVLA